jgi:Spy/CpxP family protein refolding chaperone
MKNRWFLFALALCAWLFIIAVPKSHSQDASGAQKQKLQELAKQLNLTPRQKIKLMPILEAEAPKIQAIKDNTSLTGLQKLEKIRAIHQETEPQVQAILTPEQYQQLKTIRQEEVKKAMEKKQESH